MNTLNDLNDTLFEVLDRLTSEELDDDPEKLKHEVARSKAVANIGKLIVHNARTALEGQKLMAEYSRENNLKLPESLK